MNTAWKTFLEDLAFSNGVSAILLVLSDDAHKKRLKPAILKVYKTMKLAFADDPDFE